tara:strand:- start:2299 stop:2709 length:411 start_codon:yes stop_codon:yes gene_type:complete
MNPDEIENLLRMFTVLFVVIVVMMTMNQFGVNMMTIVFAFVMLSGILMPDLPGMAGSLGSGGGVSLINMSLFDLEQYYDMEKEKAQFPGWDKQRQVTGHISDILVRVTVTMVLLVYFIKSGIFKLENLNPMKMYYA